jgi:CheY-like chemotaxis protein
VLAGGIAHDFNNILAAILGSISLSKLDLKRAGRTYKLLEEAETACSRAKELTQQLLTFSRGGAPIRKAASITELIMASSAFALRGSKVSCDLRISDGLWPADVDVGQISQVIHNLILNADQAMPAGGVIHVAGDNTDVVHSDGLPLQPGRYLKISVKDRGTGIPEEHLSKIFDPYFTTKRKGSGLGLAMVYSILKRHGGHITVESKLGVGTTFHVFLPASEKEAPEIMEEKRGPVAGKGKVLVMDDEEMVRALAQEMLVHIGYDAEVARDGSEAITLYKRAREAGEPFDAVILDLTVPGGMGGKEAMERLKEIDPEIKAIVSSGYSTDPVMSNYRDYGLRGVVAKPYDIEELSKTVNDVVQGRIGQSQRSTPP